MHGWMFSTDFGDLLTLAFVILNDIFLAAIGWIAIKITTDKIHFNDFDSSLVILLAGDLLNTYKIKETPISLSCTSCLVPVSKW